MNVQEKLFCEWFVQTGSIPEAVEYAGYGRVGDPRIHLYYQEKGRQLIRIEHVQRYIETLLHENTLKPNEILNRLTIQARATMEDFLTIDTNGHARPDFAKAKMRGKMAAIKKLKITENTRYDKDGHITSEQYTYDIELHDSYKALQTLARYYQMLSPNQPLEWDKQLWTYYVKGLIGTEDLYRELGQEEATKLLSLAEIPTPEIIDVTLDP